MSGPADQPKKFECSFCPNKSFTKKENLNHHVILVHENAGRYHCDVCGKKFQIRRKLLLHLSAHSEERPFRCEICQRSFKQKWYLKRHFLNTHTEKTFRCEICGTAFGRRGGLRNHHQMVHSGKRFHCDECPKEFTAFKSRERHRLWVHGEKKHNCDQCGKRFSVKEALRYHLLKVHSDRNERAQCGSCDNWLKPSSLASHMKKFHSAIQPNPPEQSIRDEKELKVKVERQEGSQEPASDNLRAKRKTPSYEDESEEESSSEVQDTDDESSEPDEEDGGVDEVVGRDDEEEQVDETRGNTKGLVPGGVVRALHELIRRNQKATKRDSDDQTGDEVNMVTSSNASRIADRSASPVITLSSDESQQVGALLPQSSTVSSANLKLVYDVEYRAP